MDPVLHVGLARTFRGASANVVCPEMFFFFFRITGLNGPKKTCC